MVAKVFASPVLHQPAVPRGTMTAAGSARRRGRRRRPLPGTQPAAGEHIALSERTVRVHRSRAAVDPPLRAQLVRPPRGDGRREVAAAHHLALRGQALAMSPCLYYLLALWIFWLYNLVVDRIHKRRKFDCVSVDTSV